MSSLTDPGCKDDVNGSEEWLQRNLASFSIFATLSELKNMNDNFSAVSDMKRKEHMKPKTMNLRHFSHKMYLISPFAFIKRGLS